MRVAAICMPGFVLCGQSHGTKVWCGCGEWCFRVFVLTQLEPNTLYCCCLNGSMELGSMRGVHLQFWSRCGGSRLYTGRRCLAYCFPRFVGCGGVLPNVVITEI